jgi:predicted nucleotidyltransferase
VTVTPQQLAETVKRRVSARNAELRAQAETLRAEVQRWANETVSAGYAARVWLIGSLATGSWGEASDVDVVLEGVSAGTDGRLWTELGRRLGVQVDLLCIEELPASFAESVRATGVVLA